MVHVRINGESREIPRDDLAIDRSAADRKIRRAVAEYLEIEPAELDGYAVDRPESGALIVRPEAVYG